jgi:ubiquinone/menaquinone biosynthesis C-methylase UbiE/catechol 2,3-dioxygenase-like lactoylglutathione lyase family enzyme
MKITRLNHAQITIPKGAEAQGRAFYCGMLGLQEIEKPDALKGRGGFWLQVGDMQVHVGTEDGVDRATTKAHLAYQVDDLISWQNHIENQSIEIDDSISIPGYIRFEIRDPFGNRVEFIQPVSENLVQQQIDYYRARAGEYDEWFYRLGRYDHGKALNQQWFDEAKQVMETLHQITMVDEALELACGTGIWTEQLLKIARHITALDASPEVIAINRQKLNAANIDYHQVDLFQWQPERAYDLVLFGFWLSHVPPDRLDSFLESVSRAVKPGGKLFIVDSQPAGTSSASNHQPYEVESIRHVRKLNDGREFTIYKIFYEPTTLREKLTAVGFDAAVRLTDNYFIYATAIKSESPA